MGIKVKTKGDFKNTERYLSTKEKSAFTEDQIYLIAEKSLELFMKNTPSDSGTTANSWKYEVIRKGNQYIIEFHNTNIQNGMNIAILIDEGHATASGKYVPGKHYIDHTIKEIFKFINTLQ